MEIFPDLIYADLILPLPLRERFTYAVPQEFEPLLQIGHRVSVPFGSNKVYAAIVVQIHKNKPSYATKSIIEILDLEPIVTQTQLKMWAWMASYYMCSEGEVMQCALPSGFRLDSESQIVLSPNFSGDCSGLNERHLSLIEALQKSEKLSLKEIEKLLGLKKIYPIIKTLRDRDIIWLKSEVSQRYKARKKTYIYLKKEYCIHQKLDELFCALEKRAVKQCDALLYFIGMCGGLAGMAEPRVACACGAAEVCGGAEPGAAEVCSAAEVFGGAEPATTAGSDQDPNFTIVSKSELYKNKDYANSLDALIKKGVLGKVELEESRLGFSPSKKEAQRTKTELTEPQKDCYQQIKKAFEQKDVCLLHGVTSGGKTEIYLQLIEEEIGKGGQCLFLLPEIALTTQMINRLRARFGSQIIGVYHSKYNENEKTEIWQKVLSGDYKIVLGARSALFLPYQNLKLIVVDEEHESSYKQNDPSPRYNARDTAVYITSLYKCKLILGSATPSIESYYNAIKGKYALATLFKRHQGLKLPDVYISNLKEERQLGSLKGNFASKLIEKMDEALGEGSQIILFKNRRGFSSRLQCVDCGNIPSCPHCDVSLTYHKKSRTLLCHYCGYAISPPSHCESCGGVYLTKGFGTEKIEEDLSILFPNAKVGRMDIDSTRTKNAYEKLIGLFEDKKIDILVGTQMIAKGLDFGNVALVGILDADSMLFFPDFRANERSFQLMTQVSGRSGRRKGKKGEVVLQTYVPEHRIIRAVLNSNYTAMFEEEILDRKRFLYPPFCRLIRLSVKHKEEQHLDEICKALASQLKASFGTRVLGPEYPMISKISNYYIKDFIIKIEKTASAHQIKEGLRLVLDAFLARYSSSSLRLVVDVDP